VTSEIIDGAGGWAAGSGARAVNGRLVVFRTGVKPVRGLFRFLGVVAMLRSVAGTPSDVNPWTGTVSSPSSGAGRFLLATVVVGSGPWGLEVATFAGSGVLVRKTDGAGGLSDVLALRSAEGPDLARERDGEPGATVEKGGDSVVYRTVAVATDSLLGGLSFEVDAVGCAGC
jgi:hypothetical protein